MTLLKAILGLGVKYQVLGAALLVLGVLAIQQLPGTGSPASASPAVEELPADRQPPKKPPKKPPMKDPPKNQGEVSIAHVNLDGVSGFICVCWEKDGKSFFALNSSGTLIRVNATGLKEMGRMNVEAKCTYLSLSAEGLVVTVWERKEVWLVDSETLQVSKKIAIPGLKRAVSAPGLSLAFATGEANFDHQVSVLDLKTGQVVKQHPKMIAQHPQVTPDGRYLFVQGGANDLVRYKIVNTDLIEEEKSKGIAQNGQQVCVSPDSKFVSLPSGGGNFGAPIYSTYVYRTSNLKQSVTTIKSGAYPRTMGFDPKQGLIYAQNHEIKLLVYDFKGQQLQQHNMGKTADKDNVRQFAVHPEGGKVVVVTESQLFVADTSKLHGSKPYDEPVIVANPIGPTHLTVFPVISPGLKALQLVGDGMKHMDMLPCICWAKDSQSFYTLEKTGTLRQISADGQRQLAKLNLGTACSWLSMSAEGPVVTLGTTSEMWLVSDDLQVIRHKVPLPENGMRAISAPTLSVALAGRIHDFASKTVVLIELKTGRVSKEIPKVHFRNAVLSPDGKLLLSHGPAGEIYCHEFTDGNLTVKGKTAPNTFNSSSVISSIIVSPDSRFMAALPNTIILNPGGAPKADAYTTQVFAVNNLTTPKVTIQSGLVPRALAFDPAGKWIYTLNSLKQLILFDWNGLKHQEFKLTPGAAINSVVLQVAVQPQGGKLVILSSNQLNLVDPPVGK